jgi:ABC-type uncharacterized transport system substrate-binding protein
MRRREFIARDSMERTMLKAIWFVRILTFVMGIAAPLVAAAQQPLGKMPRLGWLGNHPPSFKPYQGFYQGLRELGYVEGQNIAIEFQSARGDLDRLPELATELVRRNVDVLLVAGHQGLNAAKQATNTIPIITVACDIRDHLIASLARPGGKATGLTCLAADLASKRLEFLKEVVPSLSRVAVLYNLGDPNKVAEVKDMQHAAQQLNLVVHSFEVRTALDIEIAFEAMTRQDAQALVIFTDSFTTVHRHKIAELALQKRLPTIHGFREFPDAGGLMSYGANLHELYKNAARYVDKILKGADPGDLPVEEPTRFDLVINSKTAQALGLTIPVSILARADEVIE